MDYTIEVNGFRNWTLLNNPSTGQVALWYSLMSLNHMNGWTNDLAIPSQTLQLMTGLSKQGLVRARKRLVGHGLIQFSGQSGVYRVVPFAEDRM